MINNKTTTKQLQSKIDAYLKPFEPDSKTFPKLQGLYLHLGISRQNVYDWGHGSNVTLKQHSYTIKRTKQLIIAMILDWAANHSYSQALAMFYLKSIEKESFNEKIVSSMYHNTQQLTSTESVEPVNIIMDLPKKKVKGQKVKLNNEEVK